MQEIDELLSEAIYVQHQENSEGLNQESIIYDERIYHGGPVEGEQDIESEYSEKLEKAFLKYVGENFSPGRNVWKIYPLWYQPDSEICCRAINTHILHSKEEFPEITSYAKHKVTISSDGHGNYLVVSPGGFVHFYHPSEDSKDYH